MKISKRQLKRIIREEYSRLKRRGMIRENLGYDQNRVNDMIMFLDDLMMSERGYALENDPRGIQTELRSAFPQASMEEIQEALASF